MKAKRWESALRRETGAALMGLCDSIDHLHAPDALLVAWERLGDALRLGLTWPEALARWAQRLAHQEIEASLALLREQARAWPLSKGASGEDDPWSAFSVQRRDAAESVRVAVLRRCVAKGEVPSSLHGFAELAAELEAFDAWLGEHTTRARAERWLGARAELLGQRPWTARLPEDEAIVGEQSTALFTLDPAIAAPPSDEAVLRYVTNGALARYVEGFADKDADFAEDLASVIEGLRQAGEPVDLAARRWRNPHAPEESATPIRLAASTESDDDEDASPLALRKGEAYLLLYEEGRGRAVAARIRARAPGAMAMKVFAADARHAMDASYRALLCVAAHACRSLGELHDLPSFELSPAREGVEITGASLGLSACAAILSRALGQTPQSEIAASARVRSDGTLEPVTYLEQKLEALAKSFPQVRSVVVARGQACTSTSGLTLLERDSLAETLIDFGLDLRALPEASLEQHLSRVARFDEENKKAHTSETWRELSLQAWESAMALEADDDEREKAAESSIWSALFALHAGDEEGAAETIRSIPEASLRALSPRMRAWKDVVEASIHIDLDPSAAIHKGREAVELARGLEVKERWVLAQALGTYGRALMHAGRPDEGIPSLQEAAALHGELRRWDEPRSRVHLATCLRHASRTNEALDEVRRALELSEQHGRREVSKTTRQYAKLEEARCLLALGRFAEAREGFDALAALRPATGRDHLRLAALRGTAASRRRLGDVEGSDMALRECMSAASGDKLGKVALMAMGDALLSRESTQISRVELEAAWARVYPAATTDEAIRAIIERWVY